MVTAQQIREAQEAMESALLEMAILDKDELGFPFFAYCSPQQGSHGGRVKFAATAPDLKGTDSFSLSLERHPRLVAGTPPDKATLDNASRWVQSNLEVLQQFWNDPTSYTTKQLLAALKPI